MSPDQTRRLQIFAVRAFTYASLVNYMLSSVTDSVTPSALLIIHVFFVFELSSQVVCRVVEYQTGISFAYDGGPRCHSWAHVSVASTLESIDIKCAETETHVRSTRP